MRRHFIEITDMANWGKFELQQLVAGDLTVNSVVTGLPLLSSVESRRSSPMDPLKQVRVWDLQTGEGAVFCPEKGADPVAQLDQHRVWVCPLFQPFVAWLFTQDCTDITALPSIINLPPSLVVHYLGYRRGGPEMAEVAALRARVVEALRTAATVPADIPSFAIFIKGTMQPGEHMVWAAFRDSLPEHEKNRMYGSMMVESGRFVAAPMPGRGLALVPA